MPRRKNKHLNRYIALTATLIIISLVAAFYLQNLMQTRKEVTPSTGLHVGDTFTYKLTGSAILNSKDAVVTEELLRYNATDFYQVNVTRIDGTRIWLNTLWRFKNGTQITSPQLIDLQNGSKTDQQGFFAIYSPNLNVNDPLHPTGTDGLIVNGTDTQKFANCTRQRNFWSTESQYVSPQDSSLNTMRSVFVGVYFDKQTGILDKLVNIEFFTNPQVEFTIVWDLTKSNVWAV